VASKRIDVNINSTNAGSGFKSAGSDIAKLKSEAGSAGQTIGQSIASGSRTASSSLSSLGATANKTFGTIKAGASAARQSMGDLGNAISAVAGGIGAMEVIQAAWTGSTQKQFNQAYLQTKMSSQAASEYIKNIQQIVAEAPGDDTFMNNLLTGAVAKNTKMSNSELKQMAFIAADYMTVSKSMGKSMVETQNDLKEYLLTGNTTQLERDSILKGQMGTLEGQKTVSERILALDKAMRNEGYAGLSQLDIAAIKWEEIKGKIQLAATTIGDKVLPFVEKVFDWFLKLDEQTNGFSTVLAVAAGAVALIGLALAPVVGATLSGYYAMKAYRMEAEKAALANALNKGPGAGGPIGTSGGIMQKISDWIGTLGGVGAGAGLAVAGKSLAMRLLTGLAMGINTLGIAVVGPALMGLFENVTPDIAGSGSLFSGNWDFSAAFNKQFGPGSKIATDFGNALNAGIQGSLADQLNLPGWLMGHVVPAFSAAGAYIQGAWGNTVAYMTGAWSNTVSWVTNGLYNILGTVSWVAGSIGGSFSGAWNRIVGGYNWMRSVVSRWISTGVSVATGAIDAARNAWNSLKGFIMNNPIIGAVRSAIGFGPSGMGAARGPGIGLSYENYGGHKKNAWNAAGTGLSGNCVDMTLGLMSAYGGSMVQGTWNGGPHVWWQSPSGAQLDPARKALEGTWAPPARGPGGGNFGNIVIQGDVYGFDDFKRKVEQANASIGYDAGMF